MEFISRIENIDETVFLQFQEAVEKKSPGLIRAIELFRSQFIGKSLPFAEIRIENIVLEKEIRLLKKNKDTESFLKRNGLYAFERLTDEEKRLFRK